MLYNISKYKCYIHVILYLCEVYILCGILEDQESYIITQI